MYGVIRAVFKIHSQLQLINICADIPTSSTAKVGDQHFPKGNLHATLP